MKTITIEYLYGLGSFLDEKNIKWSSISPLTHSTAFEDLICIYLPKGYTANDVWKLCMEFNEWKELFIYQ